MYIYQIVDGFSVAIISVFVTAFIAWSLIAAAYFAAALWGGVKEISTLLKGEGGW